MGEIDIVSNQNLSMEMFLIRLLYLKDERIYDDVKNINLNFDKNSENLVKSEEIKFNEDQEKDDFKKKTISQIKNFSQEQIDKPETKVEAKLDKIEINNFEELINLCNIKKELKLKYELETNVSLVSFQNKKIEISFNENLDKDFVKELSFKLNEWTGNRWIIAFSKKVGDLSTKQKKNLKKFKNIENIKKEKIYKKILETFSDAELIDVKLIDGGND